MAEWFCRARALCLALALQAACSGAEPPLTAAKRIQPTTDAGSQAPAAGRGEAAGASGAASDPLATVLDRAQWPAYPKVKFPEENPFSTDKALLGKLLFWDEQLSSDDTMACGTCHRPAAGGSDPRPAQPGYVGHPGRDGMRGTDDDPKGSPGIAACVQAPEVAPKPLADGVFEHMPQVGRRRALSVLDAMFSDSMFWDGRVKSALVDPVTNATVIASGAALEAQALFPVLNAAEMACKGRDWNMAARKIAAARPLALATALPADLQDMQKSAATYTELFEKVFGDSGVTATRIVMAIATYERTLTGDQTPWDRWRAGDDAAMTEAQKRGFVVFARKGLCSCCHTLPLFGLPSLVDDAFHEHSWDGGGAEMGLDKPGDYTNPTFRTVSVRNAGLREASGLLHDGVAPGTSIEDLVAAYNKKPVRNVHFCRTELNLTEAEQADLVDFVRNGLTDPRAKQEKAPFDRPQLSSEK
ncbi:MAG TPA: cytochrome-c peroxidase [Polyangiales bacterium]|nr:cytochrome-c peroxidase [Polyangiales bacterium]